MSYAVLQFGNLSSPTLLLSIMESRFDQDNALRILKAVSPQNLIKAIQQAYKGQIDIQKTADDYMAYDYDAVDEGDEANPTMLTGNNEEQSQIQVVGHNIFILAVQLSRHSESLSSLLRHGLNPVDGGEASLNLKEALRSGLTTFFGEQICFLFPHKTLFKPFPPHNSTPPTPPKSKSSAKTATSKT